MPASDTKGADDGTVQGERLTKMERHELSRRLLLLLLLLVVVMLPLIPAIIDFGTIRAEIGRNAFIRILALSDAVPPYMKSADEPEEFQLGKQGQA